MQRHRARQLKLKTASRDIDTHLVTSPLGLAQRSTVLRCQWPIADGGAKGVTLE